MFKVGDRVITLGKDLGTVVERVPSFDKQNGIKDNQIAVQLDILIKEKTFYNKSFPYNWYDEKSVELLTKLHKVLA